MSMYDTHLRGCALRPRTPAEVDGSADGQAGLEVGLDLVQPDALLAHRVALADGHRGVGEGVEVDGEAERRADLVLPPAPAPARAGVVEVDVPALPHLGRQG